MLREYSQRSIRNSDLERMENEHTFFTLAKKMVLEYDLKNLDREDLQRTIKRAEIIHPCFLTTDFQEFVARLKTNLTQ